MEGPQQSGQSQSGASPRGQRPYKVRVARACARCNKDKQPCVQDGAGYIHGVTPCGRCAHLKFECVFTPPKRRGPGPKKVHGQDATIDYLLTKGEQHEHVNIYDQKGSLVAKLHCSHGLIITDLRSGFEARITVAPPCFTYPNSYVPPQAPFGRRAASKPLMLSSAGLNDFYPIPHAQPSPLDTGMISGTPAQSPQPTCAAVLKRKRIEETTITTAGVGQQMSLTPLIRGARQVDLQNEQTLSSLSTGGLSPVESLSSVDEGLFNNETDHDVAPDGAGLYISNATQSSLSYAGSTRVNVDPRLLEHDEELNMSKRAKTATKTTSNGGLSVLLLAPTLGTDKNLGPIAQHFVPAPTMSLNTSASGYDTNVNSRDSRCISPFGPLPDIDGYVPNFAPIPTVTRQARMDIQSKSMMNSVGLGRNFMPVQSYFQHPPLANLQPPPSSMAPNYRPLVSSTFQANNGYVSEVVQQSAVENTSGDMYWQRRKDPYPEDLLD